MGSWNDLAVYLVAVVVAWSFYKMGREDEKKEQERKRYEE